MSSWEPFGPSSDDEGAEKKDQPLWSGEDPAPAEEAPEPEAAQPEAAQPEPEAAPPAYEPPAPPPFASRPGVTPGDPLVGRATPPPGPLEWPPPAPAAPPPPAHPDRGPLKTPTNATLSLVFGILGLLVCPVILSVAAIGTGMSAKRQIDANPRYSGRGVAQTGIVLGAIGLAVWIVFFAIGLAGYLGLGSGL